MAGECLDPDTVLGWLDGQLSIRRAAGVEAHIDGCTACRRLVSESVAAIDGAPGPDAGEQPERLGPYEVRGVVGRGGMGEVYRAYDPRLDREVAVKVVRPTSGARLSPADLDWFEREARAAAAIANPHVVAVFDVGHHGNAPYVVTELLAGETLRTRLKRGAVPARQAIPWARELAAGMAAAHERGIVHRDLKPENVFITTDGRVKILDFGVAAVRDRPGVDGDAFEQPGLVVGTLGYMAPEQLRGEPVDHRTDIFAFGAVLFEMVTGERAFRAGDGDLELAEAALDQDPVERHADALAAVPWPVVQVIRRCLDKKPEARFQSAHDLAFALGVLDTAGPSGRKRAPTAAEPRRSARRGLALAAGALGIAAVAAGAGWMLGGRGARARVTSGSGSGSGSAIAVEPVAPAPRSVTVTAIDSREGYVFNARFMPDGKTVLATAEYRTETPTFHLSDDTRILHSSGADAELVPTDLPSGRALLAIGPKGEIATIRKTDLHAEGELTVIGSDGGDHPYDLARVDAAEFMPGGELAVISGAPSSSLEAPIGSTPFTEVGSKLFALRVSPTGDVAFLQTHMVGDTGTTIMRRDTGATLRTAGALDSSTGLAWAPNGRDLLVSGQLDGVDGVFRVDASGKADLVWASPGPVVLYDVAADGALLVGRRTDGIHSFSHPPKALIDLDVSFRAAGTIVDMSSDGTRIVQLALGFATRWRPQLYVTDSHGDNGVRIDNVVGAALSPDGKRVLARTGSRPWWLKVYPIESAVAPVSLESAPVDDVSAAGWISPDTIAILGRLPDGTAKLYRQVIGETPVEIGNWPLSWSSFRVVAPMGMDAAPSFGPGWRAWRWFRISPDGSAVADLDGSMVPQIVDLKTLKVRAIPGTTERDYVAGWIDGRTVVVVSPQDDGMGAMIARRVDLITGKSKQLRFVPQRSNLTTLGLIRYAAAGEALAYSAVSEVTQLYRVDGALAGAN